MILSKRARIAVAVVSVICAGFLARHWDRYRSVPIERALNPAYWLRHWKGQDRYDAATALLEHGDPNLNEVALTIDDGPDPLYGPAIADYLKQQGVAATFFVVGKRVKQYPAILRAIDADGFEIGNHTYDHQRLDQLKPHEVANEIKFCSRDIEEVTGKRPAIMRPPGVQYNDTVLNTAKALGYVTVSWTCGAKDYDPQPAQFIAQRVIDRSEAGSIIILHQDTPNTLKALPYIISGLRQRGFTFVTISQMLDHLHAKLPAASVK